MKTKIGCVFHLKDQKKIFSQSWAQGPAKIQLEAQLKKISKENEKFEVGPKKPYSTLQIHFTEGGRVSLLLIDPKISAYDLQCGMREAFCEGGEEISEFLVEVVSESLTNRVVEYFSSLCLLSSWEPETFGKRALDKDKKVKTPVEADIKSSLSSKELKLVRERGRAIARATNLVRTLADLPGNELHPKTYRKRIETFAKQRSLDFKFLDRKKLESLGAGAFLAVAQGDPNHSCGIAQLKYKGSKAKKKLLLVGKGLCFDTGGYNIKTGQYMYNMHRDMTGSAVALAILGLVKDLELPLEVHCFLAIAENLISPTAFRPNDIVTACDGTSIEVVDTDAEGRMVLSDTLALARREKAGLVLDFATLTGACVRAIDTQRSAVFSNHAELLNRAVEVGVDSGERTWGFPIGEDYWKALKSEIADIRQISAGNNADHIYAATFLSHFIGDETPWVHMDLAADTNKGGLGLVASETTGFGARWALGMIEKFLAR